MIPLAASGSHKRRLLVRNVSVWWNKLSPQASKRWNSWPSTPTESRRTRRSCASNAAGPSPSSAAWAVPSASTRAAGQTLCNRFYWKFHRNFNSNRNVGVRVFSRLSHLNARYRDNRRYWVITAYFFLKGNCCLFQIVSASSEQWPEPALESPAFPTRLRSARRRHGSDSISTHSNNPIIHRRLALSVAPQRGKVLLPFSKGIDTNRSSPNVGEMQIDSQSGAKFCLTLSFVVYYDGLWSAAGLFIVD